MYLWEMLTVTSKWVRSYGAQARRGPLRLGNGWTGTLRTTEKEGFYYLTCRRKGFKDIVTVVERRIRGSLVCSGCGSARNTALYMSPQDHYWYCKRCCGGKPVGGVRMKAPPRLKLLLRRYVFYEAKKREWEDIKRDTVQKFFNCRPELIPEFLRPFRESDEEFYWKSLAELKRVYREAMSAVFGPGKPEPAHLTRKEYNWMMHRVMDRMGVGANIGVSDVVTLDDQGERVVIEPTHDEIMDKLVEEAKEGQIVETSELASGA